MYDGNAINADWGNSWPAEVTDTRDPHHEFSPVLQAPVANLLGEPWYLSSSSPGGDFVTWLDLPDGHQLGVSPHPDEDEEMRWYIATSDDMGNPLEIEHELPITATPEEVAAQVRAFMDKHGITQPAA